MKLHVWCIAVLLTAAPAHAQIVRGIVRETESRAPLGGAFVAMVDSAGARRNATLTAADGSFALRAPKAGQYRLRAELIGHQNAASASFAVPATGAVTVNLMLPVEPIALAAISAESERRCVMRPQGAAETTRLWEEARKALTVAKWTETARIAEFQTRIFERQLDWPSMAVRWQGVRSGFTLTRPYAAVSPDSLAAYGFVRRVSADSVLYYGPDADVLLSEQFLDSHCFRARRGEHETAGLVGLSFEPARGQKLSDIKGTLWIDPKTNELEFIEFVYTGVDAKLNVKGVGGRTYFRRLPNGAWIVDRWSITLPIPRQTIDGHVAAGLLEGGGEIVEVKMAGNMLPKANVTGTVFDSVRGKPLATAFVYLSGTAHSATTDSSGFFRMADIPGGDYSIAFSHAVFDSMPVLPEGKAITVEPPHDLVVKLATPSASALVARICPQRRDEAAITGYVRSAAGDTVANETVTLSYFHARRWHRTQVMANEHGFYVACGLPIGTAITLWAATVRPPDIGARGGEPRTVRVESTRLMRVDLEMK